MDPHYTITTLYRETRTDGALRYHVSADTVSHDAVQVLAIRDEGGALYLVRETPVASSAIVAPFRGRSVRAALERGIDIDTLTDEERAMLVSALGPPAPPAAAPAPGKSTPIKRRGPSWRDMFAPLLDTYTDRAIAEVLGFSTTTITDYRRSRGAPPVAPPVHSRRKQYPAWLAGSINECRADAAALEAAYIRAVRGEDARDV